MDVVSAIEAVQTSRGDKPVADVVIADSGELPLPADETIQQDKPAAAQIPLKEEL